MTFSLTIIIPVYNAEKFIAKTLDSICGQQNYHFPVELVLVDDGSVDQSVSIIERYKSSCNFLKLIQQTNQGAGSARNRGLEQATGSHIWFIDADDFIEPGAFQNIECFFNDGDVHKTMAFNYYTFSKENKRGITSLFDDFRDKQQYSGLEFLTFNKPFFLWNIIFSREIILRNRLQFIEGIKNIEDFEFSLKYFSRATTVVYYNLRLYNYYENENSTSRLRTREHLLKLAADSHVVHNSLNHYATHAVFTGKDIIKHWLKFSVMGFFYSLLKIGYSKQDMIGYHDIYTKEGLLPIIGFKGPVRQQAFIRVLNTPWLFKILAAFAVLWIKPVPPINS